MTGGSVPPVGYGDRSILNPQVAGDALAVAVGPGQVIYCNRNQNVHNYWRLSHTGDRSRRLPSR